jgi:hypothetical protein
MDKRLYNNSTVATETGETLLTWRVHLARRHPERLPALVAVLVIGGACVWLMFARPLPVLAALLLLLGSAADYLTPTTYRITTRGIEARSPVTHLMLTWAEARRCLPDHAGMIVTSLSIPSRLDRFRGVLMRYAPSGEPGDRASVEAAIARCAPQLIARMRDAGTAGTSDPSGRQADIITAGRPS